MPITGIDIDESVRRHVPPHMINTVLDYVMSGVPPGDFVNAVMSDSLSGAAARADHINVRQMGAWGNLLFVLPPDCWGSTAKVAAWIRVGGYNQVNQQQGASHE